MGHASKSVGTSPSQQLQQQGLGLIILVMGSKQQITLFYLLLQCSIAQLPCPSLRAMAARMMCVDLDLLKRNRKPHTGSLAGLSPVIRLRHQPMVHVDRKDIPLQLGFEGM